MVYVLSGEGRSTKNAEQNCAIGDTKHITGHSLRKPFPVECKKQGYGGNKQCLN